MIQFFTTLRSLFYRHHRLSVVSIGAFMVFALVGMGTISLTRLNSKAMSGYQLSKLQSTNEELVQDGEVTEMLSLRARSMTVIEAASSHMVKPARADISYVLPVSVVASNDSEHNF